MLNPNQNTGLLIRPPYITDYIAGEETGINYEVRVPSADWTPYLPSPERQRFHYFDSNACVTFSALNSVEMQVDFMIASGIITGEKLQKIKDLGFIDANGKFNCSDRFTAKMSGTTINGNYLGAVWDSIRKDGLLPEGDWLPREEFSFDEYYAEIPQALKDKAKLIKDILEIRYEWVVAGWPEGTPFDQLATALRHAPIQLATPVCPDWNTGDVHKCDMLRAGHATLAFNQLDNMGTEIFDHYNPFVKKFSPDYFIPYAMKGVVMLKVPPVIEPPFTYTFTHDIEYGTRSDEVKALQKALNRLVTAKLPITGFYGPLTQAAVRTFQIRYKVATPEELAANNGRRVGPKTRSELNKQLLT